MEHIRTEREGESREDQMARERDEAEKYRAKVAAAGSEVELAMRGVGVELGS